ncbi:MAG: cytosolic protein [Chloroflexi bacterium]|nr:cytosolic protein [Chloroflexota bacterium]
MHPQKDIKAQPSPRARDLVRGAYDLHVHTAPDLMPRAITDVELARRCEQWGQAGFVIKSHYVPTAERAALIRRLLPDSNVLGAITLNNPVGGMNVLAVEIAAREGARIVWLPTFDAVNEPAGRVPPAPGAKLPFWAKFQHELKAQGVESPPVHVVDEANNVLPQTRAVLQAIAKHHLVLATGHLGRDEIFAVVDAALQEGIQHIIITHPEFPSQNLSTEDQSALAERGAFLERCFTTPYSGKVSWERMFHNIRETGPEHSFLSTDLGQPDNPSPEDGLALMVDRLLEAGFSEEEIHTMVITNTRRMATGNPE